MKNPETQPKRDTTGDKPKPPPPKPTLGEILTTGAGQIIKKP